GVGGRVVTERAVQRARVERVTAEHVRVRAVRGRGPAVLVDRHRSNGRPARRWRSARGVRELIPGTERSAGAVAAVLVEDALVNVLDAFGRARRAVVELA